MTPTEIQLLQLNNTLLIKITVPFNGGMRVVSHACLISQVRSLTAMHAPRETLDPSMTDTCPTPRIGTCVLSPALCGTRGSG